MKVKVLPAYNGDSILITLDTAEGMKNLLLDGGTGRSIFMLAKELKRLKEVGQAIDLLVVTHIDDDHIAGIIKLFNSKDTGSDIVKKVWFNSGARLADFFATAATDGLKTREVTMASEGLAISVKQGNTLESQLIKTGIWDGEVIYNELEPFNFFGAAISVLSPSKSDLSRLHANWATENQECKQITAYQSDYNKTISQLVTCELPAEDAGVTNGSSIALLLEHKGQKTVYLADAHPSTIVASIKKLGYSYAQPLSVGLVKLAHHGSSRNINKDLLSLIRCDKYIISTNGSKHGLPNKLCLAKIIEAAGPQVMLFFNYGIVNDKKIFSQPDYDTYKFKCVDLSQVIYNYEIDL